MWTSGPQWLDKRGDLANEMERRSQTDGRKARRLWGHGSQEESGCVRQAMVSMIDC